MNGAQYLCQIGSFPSKVVSARSLRAAKMVFAQWYCAHHELGTDRRTRRQIASRVKGVRYSA